MMGSFADSDYGIAISCGYLHAFNPVFCLIATAHARGSRRRALQRAARTTRLNAENFVLRYTGPTL
jgi:hypothetical protein